MGCSSSALPPEILPDPGDTEECVFTIASAGMFSNDCYAYKGDSTDKKDRWFLLHKIKEEAQRKVDLENFVRVNGSKKGEVLWTAAFDSKPSFEMNEAQGAPPPWATTCVGVQIPAGAEPAVLFDVTMPSGATVRVAAPAGSSPGQVIQVADPGVVARPDYDYWRRLHITGREGEGTGMAFGLHMGNTDQKQMDKFTLRTRALIAPGTRGRALGEGFELQVYARGTSVCHWHWETGTESGDGARPKWRQETKSFVDALHFNLVQTQTGQSVATWSAAGDDVTTDKETNVVQENPVFALAMKGWLSKSIRLETRPQWDPCLALIVAYLCSKEYYPKDIRDGYAKFFQYPREPRGFEGSEARYRTRTTHPHTHTEMY